LKVGASAIAGADFQHRQMLGVAFPLTQSSRQSEPGA
jgi:hypothetical protein